MSAKNYVLILLEVLNPVIFFYILNIIKIRSESNNFVLHNKLITKFVKKGIRMNYSCIIKKIITGIILILIFFMACKISLFYIPFIIAYIISLLVEPIIKFLNKRTSFSRKVNSIIVLATITILLIGILVWGGIKLVSETTNLLSMINTYLDKTINLVNEITKKINIYNLNLSEEVISVFENSTKDFINTVVNYIKNFLTQIIKYISSLPNILINVIITILATYFITSDKFYILDRMEHHLSKKMVGKIVTHTKQITSSLGKYLKAEITLSIITFIVVLTGLNIFYLLGMEVEYPILMALLIGFVDALPILGAGSIMIPWAIILILNKKTSLAISIFGLYIFTLVEKQLLEPKLVSNNIGIHPIFTLIAMYTSFKMIGIIGLLVRTYYPNYFKEYFF